MRFISLIAAVATAGAIARAGAITTYSDRTAFNTAVGPVTLEGFTDTPHKRINPGVLNSFTDQPGIGITPGVIQPGVTYTANVTGPDDDFNIDFGGLEFVGGFLDSVIFHGETSRPLTATFTGPVAAFGFDTSSSLGGTQSIQINFSAGDPFTATLIPGNSIFFGFQSSAQDIVSMVLQYRAPMLAGFAVDNFAFTATGAPAVPEPTSILLLGGGLVGLGVLGSKRRRSH